MIVIGIYGTVCRKVLKFVHVLAHMPRPGYKDLQVKEHAYKELAIVCHEEIKASTWTECILKLIEVYRRAKQHGLA